MPPLSTLGRFSPASTKASSKKEVCIGSNKPRPQASQDSRIDQQFHSKHHYLQPQSNTNGNILTIFSMRRIQYLSTINFVSYESPFKSSQYQHSSPRLQEHLPREYVQPMSSCMAQACSELPHLSSKGSCRSLPNDSTHIYSPTYCCNH